MRRYSKDLKRGKHARSHRWLTVISPREKPVALSLLIRNDDTIGMLQNIGRMNRESRAQLK